jgi:hypothetical protein
MCFSTDIPTEIYIKEYGSGVRCSMHQHQQQHHIQNISGFSLYIGFSLQNMMNASTNFVVNLRRRDK